MYSKIFLFIFFQGIIQLVTSQDTSFHAKHAAILFPYPMYEEKWRSSIGFNLLTTPEDITEEVRIRVPSIDWHVLRRINDYVVINGRLLFFLTISS